MSPMQPLSPSIRETLARNLRDARDRMGISQLQLAERAEISPSHMNELERGRAWASADTLERIADALRVLPYMLLLPAQYDQPLDHRALLATFASRAKQRIGEAVEDTLEELLRDEYHAPESVPESGDAAEPGPDSSV